MSDFKFNLGGVEIAVLSDLPEVIDDLSALYPGHSNGVGNGAPAITIEVKQVSGLPSRRYTVLGDGEPFGEDIRRREVLPYLEWAVNWRVITRCTDRMLVHAASMARDGQGVVFAGQSGAGKSTLVAGLLARGWQYLCDEFAMIEISTGRLLPFPKAVCIKAGSFDLVRQLDLKLCGDRYYVKALKGKVGYLSPSDLPGAVARPCPITHIVFPSYTGYAKSRLRPATDAKAAFMLAAHTLNRDVLGEQVAATASRVTRDAQCVVLDSGDLGDACDLIESIVC